MNWSEILKNEAISNYIVFVFGIVVGVLGWAISQYISRKKPQVIDVVKTEEISVLEVDSNIKQDIKIEYKGNPVQSLYRTGYHIFNRGESTIDNIQFEIIVENQSQNNILYPVILIEEAILMKIRHLFFIPFLFLFGELSSCSLAQAKTIYRCERYRRIDGTSAFRVSPSISGSFTGPYLVGGFVKVSVQACFVPITKKQCFYKDKEPDPTGLTPHRWYKCGRQWLSSPSPGRFIETTFGKGEIVEDNKGKKYHVFTSVVQFAFE